MSCGEPHWACPTVDVDAFGSWRHELLSERILNDRSFYDWQLQFSVLIADTLKQTDQCQPNF